MGQGGGGISASSKLLYGPCSQHSSALNSGVNHLVTPVNQQLGKTLPLENVPYDRTNTINLNMGVNK